MLPKNYRITAQEFYKNTAFPRRIISPSLHLLFKKTSRNLPGYVIVVPKGVEPKSVRRHRIKRILTETIRPALKDMQPYEVMIKVQKPAATAKDEELKKTCAALLIKATSSHQ